MTFDTFVIALILGGVLFAGLRWLGMGIAKALNLPDKRRR